MWRRHHWRSLAALGSWYLTAPVAHYLARGNKTKHVISVWTKTVISPVGILGLRHQQDTVHVHCSRVEESGPVVSKGGFLNKTLQNPPHQHGILTIRNPSKLLPSFAGFWWIKDSTPPVQRSVQSQWGLMSQFWQSLNDMDVWAYNQ